MTGEERPEIANTISGGIQFGPVLQGRDIQATFQLPAAPVALAQLPPPVTAFAGRDDELSSTGRPVEPRGTEGPVVVRLCLAGIGKTSLAVQAGHAASNRGWLEGGVLFIDLHGYD